MCLTVLLMMLMVMAASCEGEYFIDKHGDDQLLHGHVHFIILLYLIVVLVKGKIHAHNNNYYYTLM